jgi:hypothetical protein
VSAPQSAVRTAGPGREIESSWQQQQQQLIRQPQKKRKSRRKVTGISTLVTRFVKWGKDARDANCAVQKADLLANFVAPIRNGCCEQVNMAEAVIYE